MAETTWTPEAQLLLAALNAHVACCEWCSRGDGGCEIGERIEDVMLRVDPRAYDKVAPPAPEVSTPETTAGLEPDVLAAQAATLAPSGKQRRFEFVPAMYALYAPAMCETARDLGYALCLHGSMARDLDVVAVPWTETAAPAKELVARLVERHKFTLKQEDGTPTIREKPHGRRGWVLWFGGHFYVDLSVMPLAPPSPAPEVRALVEEARRLEAVVATCAPNLGAALLDDLWRSHRRLLAALAAACGSKETT